MKKIISLLIICLLFIGISNAIQLPLYTTQTNTFSQTFSSAGSNYWQLFSITSWSPTTYLVSWVLLTGAWNTCTTWLFRTLASATPLITGYIWSWIIDFWNYQLTAWTVYALHLLSGDFSSTCNRYSNSIWSPAYTNYNFNWNGNVSSLTNTTVNGTTFHYWIKSFVLKTMYTGYEITSNIWTQQITWDIILNWTYTQIYSWWNLIFNYIQTIYRALFRSH